MNSEIQEFFSNLNPSSEASPPDDSAVFHARKKLVPEAYLEMNRIVFDYYLEFGTPTLWHGFQLMCIDGTTLRLPNTPEVVQVFPPILDDNGVPTGVPLARLTEIYDPLNNLTMAFHLSDFFQSEQEHFRLLLDQLSPKQLLLADCNYDAGWIFAALASRQAAFCIRMDTHTWNAVKDFIQSGKLEAVVTINLSSPSIKTCEAHGYPTEPIRLRLIRVELPSGEIEVLATSLLDNEAYPACLFKELYGKRWGIEEKFKRDKCRTCLENFSGKSAWVVKQDVFARLWADTMMVLMAAPAQKIIKQETSNCKLSYKFNWTRAITTFKRWMSSLFFGKYIDFTINKIHKDFLRNLTPIRPNRKFERNHKPYKRVFYPNYKPVP